MPALRTLSSGSLFRRALLTLFAALSGLSIGCTKIPSTQVTLVLFADEEIAPELEEMALDIFGSGVGEAPLLTEALRLGRDELPASIALVPLAGDASRQFGAEARASDDEGRLRAIVRARGSYMEDEARTAYLRFDAECLDILDCSNDETCSLGRCVSSALQPEDYGVLEREGGFRMPPRAIKDRVILARGDEHHLNPLANDLDPEGGELTLLTIAYGHEEDAGEVEFEFSENGETLLRALRGGESDAIDLIYTLANGADLRAKGRIEILIGEPLDAIVCQEDEWISAIDEAATVARCEPLTACEAHQRALGDEASTDGRRREDRRCCHHHLGDIVLGGEGEGWPEFEEDCLHIEGNVRYEGVSYTPAKGGEALIEVSGSVNIHTAPIENLLALKGLYRLGGAGGDAEGSLDIEDCPALLDLSGLESLTFMRGQLSIRDCPLFSSMRALRSLREVGSLWLRTLPALSSLEGFESLKLSGGIWLDRLEGIVDFTGFESLIEISSSLWIHGGTSFSSFDGFEALERIGGDIQVQNSPALCIEDVNAFANRFEPPPELDIFNVPTCE